MKYLLIALFLLCFCVPAQGQSALQQMVQTEQAFSKMADDKTIREAFMAFIADDGLLFRPGAVNGKKWMLEHPGPPSDKKPRLAWQPAFAGMAESGDLGFTTGPWEGKSDINDKTPTAYGHFVTLWKKQEDGSWKFVVDLGISHPQSGGPQKLWQPPNRPSPMEGKPVISSVGPDAYLEELLARDRSFSDATAKQGLVKAFGAFASPQVRLYRNGELPVIGRPASAQVLAKNKDHLTWKPIGGDASIAGDLGYTHGAYEVADATNKVIERGSYVRIWKKEAGAWRVVLDVANVHPE